MGKKIKNKIFLMGLKFVFHQESGVLKFSKKSSRKSESAMA
jgi:hypothetical protein